MHVPSHLITGVFSTGLLHGMYRYHRRCDLCHMDVIADEQLFIFTCPVLDSVRQHVYHLFDTRHHSSTLFPCHLEDL